MKDTNMTAFDLMGILVLAICILHWIIYLK